MQFLVCAFRHLAVGASTLCIPISRNLLSQFDPAKTVPGFVVWLWEVYFATAWHLTRFKQSTGLVLQPED